MLHLLGSFYLAVSVGSTGSVRALAGIFALVVKTSSVLRTLAVVEALSSPASYQGVASVSSPGHDTAGYLDERLELGITKLTDRYRLVSGYQSGPDLHCTPPLCHKGSGHTESRTSLSWSLLL